MKKILVFIFFCLSIFIDCGRKFDNPKLLGVISLSSSYSINIAVQGLSGSGLIVTNNATDDLTISQSGSYTFSQKLQNGNTYSVTVKSQPTSPIQICSVSNQSGRVNGANVNGITVNCSSDIYTVAGTLTQLTGGSSIVLQNNGADNLTLNANGSFIFSSSLANGSSYLVTVLSQSSNQNCVVTNASGTISQSNITNIQVTCTGNAYGALYNGTIFNPLSFTGSGVTTFLGSPLCAPNSTCVGTSGSSNTSPVSFNLPDGIATDGTNLFVADRGNNLIRQVVISSGVTTTLAGNGVTASVDGVGTSASIDTPRYIGTDGVDLYIGDNNNHGIRKVNIATGVATTLITNNVNTFDPRGMIIKNNSIYFIEGQSNSIKQYDLANGNITTQVSGLTNPNGMTIIGNTLYFTDLTAHSVLATTIGVWTVSTLAGTGIAGYVNSPGVVQFNSPERISTDGTNLYVSEVGNNTIRKIIISSSTVSTLAGPAVSSSGYTNSSIYSNALFSFPRGITSDGQYLYVADRNNHAIRRIN